MEFSNLMSFFHVENIRERTKIKAQKAYDKLKRKVSNLKDRVLVQNKRKNKVRIDISCPVLELPLSNNALYEPEKKPGKILIEEKWMIAMGDFAFQNYKE